MTKNEEKKQEVADVGKKLYEMEEEFYIHL